MSPRSLTVVDPGLLSTVQDLGRRGWAHLGVPTGGALDRSAATLANRLVGNPEGAAVVECTLTGAVFRAEAAVTVAVTGACADVYAGRRARPFGEAFAVPAGSELRLGAAVAGARTYLAVAGGIDTPVVLGSRATDLLSGLGAGALAVGDRLPVGARPSRLPRGECAWPSLPPELIELHPAHRMDWLTPEARRRLADSSYTVSQDSNRIAARLSGPPLTWAVEGELASEPLPEGAVQVPPSGQPVLFLADRPVTGGYPVVAVVDPAQWSALGQLAPGHRVRFRWLG